MDIIKKISDEYQVRKSEKQKSDFIDLIKTYCAENKLQCTEEKEIINRNIIVGNLDDAKVICTAHYDTCAVMPFPRFVAPQNRRARIWYNIIIVAVISLVALFIGFIVGMASDSKQVAEIFSLFILILFPAQSLAGVPNKHTANDNTSGVMTLLSIMNNLHDTNRNKIAFVFFDNEELFLLGSRLFKRKHKLLMDEKLLINFDCVSDGDNILVVCSEEAQKSPKYNCLKKCFEENAKSFGKKPLFEKYF